MKPFSNEMVKHIQTCFIMKKLEKYYVLIYLAVMAIIAYFAL
jgi:hypothetical protein